MRRLVGGICCRRCCLLNNDWLAREHVFKFFGTHSSSRISHRNLHAVSQFSCRDGDPSAFRRELAGIVGYGVDHEERERLVGLHDSRCVLHLQVNPFQHETHAPALHHIEKILQAETFHTQAHLALTHLYPAGENFVVVANLVGQFAHVGKSLGPDLLRLVLLKQSRHLIDDAVDERHDAVDERHLGPLLKIAALVALDLLPDQHDLFAQFLVVFSQLACPLGCFLLPFLQRLQEGGHRNLAVAALSDAVEQIEQCQNHQNHHHHRRNHGIEQARRLLQLVASGFQLAVLSCLLLHVEIDVAVDVAAGFIVDSRIDKAELLANAGHQVGSAVDGCVALQGVEQANFSRLIVVDAPEALGKRAIGSRRLIDVAIVRENLKSALGQIAGKERVGHFVRVQQSHGGQVVTHKAVAQFRILQMLAQSLQGLRLEERIAVVGGQLIAAKQVPHLRIERRLGQRLVDNAARTHIVEIVQQLRRVALDRTIRVDLRHCSRRLFEQAYIIKIGGLNNAELTLGIGKPIALMFIQTVDFLTDAMQAPLGPLAVVVEQLVLGLALAEAHVLHVGHKLFNDVVGLNAVEQGVGAVVVHLGYADECKIVQGLGPPHRIARRAAQSLLGIDAGRIERTIVVGIRLFVQPVNHRPLAVMAG